jgi:hypothetical protein
VDNERLIAELSRALSQRGLSVRSEALYGAHAGGECLLKGKRVVLLNTKAPPVERLIVLADCLAGQPQQDLMLSVEARSLIQRRLARRSEVVSPPRPRAPVWPRPLSQPSASASYDDRPPLLARVM